MKDRILEIGGVKLKNPFLAAPLAGITDITTRAINYRMGASMCYSEMISGKGLKYNNKGTENLLKTSDEDNPLAYQIFGSNPEIMGWTAKSLKDRRNKVIDINMGCPVPKIVKNGEGSALLKKPHLIYDIVSETVKNACKPVTVKIRIGWDEDTINCLEVAKIIQKAGASAVAIHGRTRMQYYSGKADWQAIKEVKENLRIPVIGNGDIFDGNDALKMMEYTGCDMVMIGRGMLGNPWIFKECNDLWLGKDKPKAPDIDEKINLIKEHLNSMILDKGEDIAVKEMRKHMAWYTKGITGSASFRREINNIKSGEEVIRKLEILK